MFSNRPCPKIVWIQNCDNHRLIFEYKSNLRHFTPNKGYMYMQPTKVR